LKQKDNLLVIIPARGGSKRIPKKNIKTILGQPMIYWPLKELSKEFKPENILISTDDKNIITLVEKIGLNVPFLRPKNLSDDFTGTIPVINHALEWYENNIKKVDFVVIVYPTALFLKMNDLKKAIKMLKSNKENELVMSATDFPSPIQRGIYLDKFGFAKMFYPYNYDIRSQDLKPAYYDAGQFYVWRSESIRQSKTLVNSKAQLLKINRNFVIDIDTTEDVEIAKNKLKLFKLDKFDKSWKFT